MDEIGHMEKDSPLFLRAVFEALDGDIPVLAGVRYTTGTGDYLERIRRHPRVRLYMLTEDNRDAVYDEIRTIIFADRKEAKELEPL
jgi:nucleoside-triphosphatase THEP1